MARRRRRRTQLKASNRPSHFLKMKGTNPEDKGWSRVAAIWVNPDGPATVRLNRGVILDWHDFGPSGDHVLILVPNEDE